jgi:hypothetical protein
MTTTTKEAIVVNEFNKFNSLRTKDIIAELLFRNGYWNVFKYDECLEKFLKDNSIDYTCKDLIDFM